MPETGNNNGQNSPQQCCGVCEASGQRTYRAMGIALHLLALTNLVSKREEPEPNDEDDSTKVSKEEHEKHLLLYSMRNIHDHKNRTLLHLASGTDACPLGRYPVTTFPSSEVVETLLRCGFDPDAIDSDGNSPLHIAANAASAGTTEGEEGSEQAKEITETVKRSLSVLNLLMKNRAHVDTRNEKGNIPMEILPKFLSPRVNATKYESLQCLAARAIVKHKLLFINESVPETLWNFIIKH